MLLNLNQLICIGKVRVRRCVVVVDVHVLMFNDEEDELQGN